MRPGASGALLGHPDRHQGCHRYGRHAYRTRNANLRRDIGRRRTPPVSWRACGRRARIILGKTVTQSFACGGLVRTANPLNTDHTAGGSSSGSAAAVAAKMVPVSVGTQSASSTIRPASYNGLVCDAAFLGVDQRLRLQAVYTASCDTIGLLARSVDDIELLWTACMGAPFRRGRRSRGKPVLGFCRPSWLAGAEPSARDAVDKAERAFAAAGAEIRHIVLPECFEALPRIHEEIHDHEGAVSYAYEYHHFRERLDPKVLALIERGRLLSTAAYLDDMMRAREARALFPGVVGDCDCLVAAAAPGEAPKGWNALGDDFQALGDPMQSRAWTILQVPAVTVPCHTGPAGLPVGIQMIGCFGADLDLLCVARWAAEVLGSAAG